MKWYQQAKITASDAEAWDMFGYSVSISGDYAIAGAYRDETQSGAAYIFKRDGSSWIQCDKLTGGDGYFGRTVSISGDYAVVGSYMDFSGVGSVTVFKREGASWNQQTVFTGAGDDHFGRASLIISGDYVIVGADGDGDNGAESGAAYIYKRDGSSWSQQAKITASDAESNDHFGISVSMSGDYAIVGAYQDDDNGVDSGSAYIFKRDGATWSQQAKITANAGTEGDSFGWSVSIFGNYAIVGAYQDDVNGTDSGSGYVFKRDGTSWIQQEKITALDAKKGDRFGYSVSISGDYAIMGADEDDATGSAYIHEVWPSIAEISDPVPGTELSTTTVTFTWDNSGADKYWLWVGISPGGKDVYSDGQGTNTSRTVGNLPSAGSVYVRLFSLAGGDWFYNDYTYTAVP
ncbi:MAG: hypothetical protein GY749_12835 [Desulfobacteraceae bacterium]|nr:hypothetical protein [Desulfobacteraceae bacterium]